MPVALPFLAAADLLTILAWVVCLGLVIVWRHTIGAGLTWLADEMDKAAIHLPYPIGTVHIFGPISSALRTVEKNVAHWLGEAALATEHATMFLWNHTVSIVEEIAKWVEESAKGYLLFAQWLLHEFMPNFRALILTHVEDLINSFRAEVHKATAAIERFAAREIHRVEARTEQIVHHAEAVITADVLPRIRTAEHDIEALKDKLERISRSFTKAGIVALIGATIWKELFNGVKCSTWGNLIKNRGCGAWQGLETLLGLFVDLFIVTDLCDVIPLVEAAYIEVGAPAVRLLTEAISLSPCVSGNEPAVLAVPRLYLPANPSLALSLP